MSQNLTTMFVTGNYKFIQFTTEPCSILRLRNLSDVFHLKTEKYTMNRLLTIYKSVLLININR